MSAQPYAATNQPTRGSRGGGIALIILGSIVALIAFGLLAGGGVLMWAGQTQRDATGYLTSPSTRLETSSYAIAATDLNVTVDAPGWHVGADALGSVRIRAASGSSSAIFIGIAPANDVLQYLSGAAYDQLNGYAMASGGPTYQPHNGGAPSLPTSQTFWGANVSGSGTQSLTWKVESGHWAIVLMNADGSRGVAADVSVGATAPFLFALALGLLIGGGIALLIAGALLFGGIAMLRSRGQMRSETWAAPPPPAGSFSPSPQFGIAPPPPPVASSGIAYPLRIEGRLDVTPSRWLWLVKWVLLIPHYVVLAFLGVAAFVLTVIAFFAILFTGRYPRSIFDFNVAVLRWWWRVGFYGYSALGTDQYPPFTFDVAAEYPATLEIPYPERLSRRLVLVKWWLLAIPHYLIVAVLIGGTTVAVRGAYTYAVPYTGLITVLVFVAAVAVLFTKRYPRGIFDLVMGLNRWVYRVLVYVLLLRDEYPPFRLDMGGEETTGTPNMAAPAPPGPQGYPQPHGI
jgi:Domain of unknown function (DUF4389)